MNYCDIFECYKGQALRDRQAIRAERGRQLVRIIAQRTPNLILDSSPDNPCEFTGEMGSFAVNIARDMGYNCTASTEIQGELGPDGNYTGYLGQLQQGTADFGFIYAPMPVPGDPVDYGTVSWADKISFTTLYKRPHKPIGSTDLLESILQVDLWSVCIFAALYALCVAVLKIVKHKRPWFSLVEAQFQHVGLSGNIFGLKALGLTMTAFFFLINTFYSNFILEALVRQEHPKVLRHFFDILDPEVDLYVGRTFMVRDILRNSKIPRVRAISDKIDKLTLKKVLIKEGRDAYNMYREPKERLFGYLSAQNSLMNSRPMACTIVPHDEKDVKQSLWIPKDSPYEFLTTAVYSKRLDNSIKQVLDLAMMRGFEHQVYTDIWLSRLTLKLQELLMPGLEPDPLCYPDYILVETASNNEGITMSNILMTLLALCHMCFLALVAQLWEMRHNNAVGVKFPYSCSYWSACFANILPESSEMNSYLKVKISVSNSLVNICLILGMIKIIRGDLSSEPFDETMVPLYHHHRLLGFVAMMDEPHHHLKIKPDLPVVLETKFRLYEKRSIRAQYDLAPGLQLSYNLSGKSFARLRDKYDKVYVVVHGFQEAVDRQYQDLTYDLLSYNSNERPAVILVDWQKGAMSARKGEHLLPELMRKIYGQAVANTIVVGREVALLSYMLTNTTVISRQNLHYIGNGLGAQVMHFAGQWYKYLEDVVRQDSGEPRGAWRIGRITGLDPSARDFQGYGTVAKLPYLNKHDADFVDIIHTSSVKNGGNDADIENGRYGMSVLAGHADFYPNGGQEQPFCGRIPKCSHERALKYFAASLTTDSHIKERLSSLSFKHNRHNWYPKGRLSFLRRFLKPKAYSPCLQRYMGIEATSVVCVQTDNKRRAFYSDFALDSEGRVAFVETTGRPELQLVDILQPAILSEENHDFSKFPVVEPNKTVAMHPLEVPGCGRFLAPPNDEARVHFGFDPYVKQFPWTVCLAMVQEFEDGETYVATGCTGSLIRDDFVVTAAHCFNNYATDTEGHPELRLDNRPIYLLFGIDCLRPILTRQVPVRQDVTVFIHPSYVMYEGSTSEIDIALIKLVDPIPAAMLPIDGQFTNTTVLNTVCWRTSKDFDYSDTCEKLYFSGYGIDDGFKETASDSLKWTIMKLVDFEESNLSMTEIDAVNAEGHGTRNTCPGDSGGPLIQVVKATGGGDQLLDELSPYTAIIVGTVIGGSPPCYDGRKNHHVLQSRTCRDIQLDSSNTEVKLGPADDSTASGAC
ncbi:Pancreatic lipase-related protein 2 [Halotydeus destructor]|nr:Pancreatic lipase-related protein 2 [Halotydeus destructor]